MNNILKIILFIGIISQLIISQHIEESKAVCSKAQTARLFIDDYSYSYKSQNDFDVKYYDIDLQIFPETESLSGSVGIVGRSLINALTQFEIDLRSNMVVDSVKMADGDLLNYTHIFDVIIVELPKTFTQDENFHIIIYYNGQPEATGYGSLTFEMVNDKPMISTLSEPYGARDWWPCKDTPLDKADSVDISVNVPEEFVVASNGLLVDEVTEDGWKTYHWEERYPIATYLVSLAIYPYTVYYDWYKYSPVDSMRLEYYVYSTNSVPNGLYSKTSDMLHAFALRFGEYPFINEKYGHAQFTWGGSMEHQTLSSMGYNQTERTVAHELAHQWWGDMVTCANFHHIWLNEGFATYSEALWNEARDGDMASLHSTMAGKAGYYFNNPNGRYGDYTDSRIYVADTTSQSRIFDYSLTYQKAAWVMHMLRHVVGDSAFFNGLKEYGDRYRFKSVVTEQFRDVMEDVSGLDLDSFFQQWIYGELYPIYFVSYNQLNDGDLILYVKQTDESVRAVFEMPVDIVAICDDNTELNWTIQSDLREQKFILNVPTGKIIDEVKFDPEHWILAKVAINKDYSLAITENAKIIEQFNIDQIYPNPFNAGVTIRFTIENEGEVQLNIFDINGNRVWHQSVRFTAGNHSISWDGKNKFGINVPSGTYFIEANNGTLTKTKKMLLLK